MASPLGRLVSCWENDMDGDSRQYELRRDSAQRRRAHTKLSALFPRIVTAIKSVARVMFTISSSIFWWGLVHETDASTAAICMPPLIPNDQLGLAVSDIDR